RHPRFAMHRQRNTLRMAWLPCPAGLNRSKRPIRLGPVVSTFTKILQHAVAVAHGESDDRYGGGFVRRRRKNSRITNVEVRNVVGLSPLVGDGSFRIGSHAADSSFMQTRARSVGFAVSAPHFAARRFEEIDHHLF